jgi:hypothetical protein
MSADTKKPDAPTPWSRGMQRVAVIPWSGIEGAYLCVSGQRSKQERVGDKWYAGHEEGRVTWTASPHANPRISFLFDAGNCCAEWDGDHGPVQLWFKCEADFVDGYDKARPHWFYPYAHGSGHWSQLAVDEDDLPGAFVSGDYERIFATLERWARRV